MSPLIQHLEIMGNWNGVIAPFSFKMELMQEFPYFEDTTDVKQISDFLRQLTDYFEGNSSKLDLYVFDEVLVIDANYIISTANGNYTYEKFCDEVQYYFNQRDSAPIPYCLRCVENYERPTYEGVQKALDKENVMNSMKELPE